VVGLMPLKDELSIQLKNDEFSDDQYQSQSRISSQNMASKQ